jgi:hypothetical protein
MKNIAFNRPIKGRIGRTLLCLGVFGVAVGLSLMGCSKPPAGPPISATDPGGLGTPQERLKMLDANTTMDPRLKEKKRKILMDEINGTHTAFGHPHQ